MDDAGTRMKVRMREDLRAALKGARSAEVALIRQLIAALDQAEAVPVGELPASLLDPHVARTSAEVERRLLDEERVHALVLSEIASREREAQMLENVGRHDRSAELHADILLAKRYLEAS